MESGNYYYSEGNNTEGPISKQRISALIRSGEIKKGFWICTDDTDWVIASSISEFQGDFETQLESDSYFYSEGNDTEGPFSKQRISTLIRSGEIKKDFWICTGATDWVIANSISEFQEDFEAQSPILPQQTSSTETIVENKDSILKMPWINENPFRILDVPVTASKREIEKALSIAKAFTKIGKTLSPKSGFGLPHSPEITMESLEKAKSDINQPEKRIQSSIFWFWEGSAIDKMAFDAIKNKDEGRAWEIWDKVCKERTVSKSNFSSTRNLSLYSLANSGNGGVLSEDSLRDSLSLAGNFFSSEYLESYLEALPVERKKNVEIHHYAKDFANHVLDSLSECIGKSNFTQKKLIECFEDFPQTVVDLVKAKFTQKEINQVETEIENAKKTSSEKPAEAIQSAKGLLKKTKPNLRLLSEILGKDDLKYKGLCNEVAWELRQSSIGYFNHAREASPPFDPGTECLALVNVALELYSEGRTGKELRQDREFLKDWIASKDQREEEAKFGVLAESIKSSLEEAERTGGLNAAEKLLKDCIPIIDSAKAIVNDPQLIINISDIVVTVAAGLCIDHCNTNGASIKALNILNKTKKLDLSVKVRSFIIRNSLILTKLLKNNSSGCYVATMIYGSYDSPEVVILRNYRDNKLSKHAYGRICIRLYYRFSPVFVSITKDIRFVHLPIRFMLNKIIKCISER
jgi:hypothetical protein